MRLSPEAMLEIVELVNGNYENSVSLKHKKEMDVFKSLTIYYDSLQKSIMGCNKNEVYGDVSCIINSLSSFDKRLQEKARISYTELSKYASTIEEKIFSDFYLVNYYYFMSKVYSECNIRDKSQRLDCLCNVNFLEIEIAR